MQRRRVPTANISIAHDSEYPRRTAFGGKTATWSPWDYCITKGGKVSFVSPASSKYFLTYGISKKASVNLMCSRPMIFCLQPGMSLICSVDPPKACPKIWWPKQLPNSLMSLCSCMTFLMKAATTGTKRLVSSCTARAEPGNTNTLIVFRSSSEGNSQLNAL